MRVDDAEKLPWEDPFYHIAFAVLQEAANNITHLDPDDRDRKDAERWINNSEAGGWPLSFVNICDNLGIEPSVLRKAICFAPSVERSARFPLFKVITAI